MSVRSRFLSSWLVRWASALGFVAILLAVGMPAQAADFPPGSWRQSCMNPRIQGSDDFTADCRTRDGRVVTSRIDMDSCGRNGPVGNDNGRLVCERYGGGNQGGGKWWGQGLPAGSYQRSCRNARIEGRDLLIAQCQRQNGSFRNTRLDIDECRGRDIANDNGHLECGGKIYGGSYGQYKLPPGSWSQSCRNARIVRDDLIAECRERDGGWNRTSLDLDDCRNRPVSNDNGRLRCGQSNQGGNYRMPGGSWAQSCRNAQIRGDDLYAQCRGRDGQWHNTRIDLDRCPNRGLVNDNGELRCS